MYRVKITDSCYTFSHHVVRTSYTGQRVEGRREGVKRATQGLQRKERRKDYIFEQHGHCDRRPAGVVGAISNGESFSLFALWFFIHVARITTYTLPSYRSPVLSACFRENPPSWGLRRVSPPCTRFTRFLRQAFARFQTCPDRPILSIQPIVTRDVTKHRLVG